MTTKEGRALLQASEKNRLVELVRLLNEKPTLVNYKDSDGYTALHRASYAGNKDCAKYLIKQGANIEARTNEDWTPLHSAVRWNNIIVANVLVGNGSDINAKSNGGNTPLHIVASNGSFSITCDIIQLLLYQPNCDFKCKNNSHDTSYDIAKRSGPLHRLWVGVMTLIPDGFIYDEPTDGCATINETEIKDNISMSIREKDEGDNIGQKT